MSVCLSSMKEIESKRTKGSYRTRPSLETMKNLTVWCELKYMTTITSNQCTLRQQYCLYVTVTTLEASLVSNNQLQALFVSKNQKFLKLSHRLAVANLPTKKTFLLRSTQGFGDIHSGTTRLSRKDNFQGKRVVKSR